MYQLVGNPQEKDHSDREHVDEKLLWEELTQFIPFCFEITFFLKHRHPRNIYDPTGNDLVEFAFCMGACKRSRC